MEYLVDTNVAARRVLTTDPLHGLVKRAVDTLLLGGHTVFVTPQCLIEFQALATRPLTANGLGMTPAEANSQAKDIERAFGLLEETPAVYLNWRKLMEQYDVLGRQVYDARLVAVMQTYGISHFLTANPGHFRRFPGIVVIEPHQVPGIP